MDIVIIIGDTHAGSTVGLCPPLVNLDDGGTYKSSPGQRWLWDCWLKFSARVKAIADANPGATVTTVFNGDIVDADSKKRSNQIITRNRADILNIATETIKPLVDISTRAFFIRGTAAHVGKSAELEEELASDCTIAEHAPGGTASWWNLYAEFSGVCFDIAHHGPIGRTPWNRAGPLMTYTYKLIQGYIKRGERVPDVAIRSHNHLYADTGANYDTLGIADLAWQLSTEYTHRLPVTELADIGGLVFICKEKGYTWEKVQYKPKASKPWVSKKS